MTEKDTLRNRTKMQQYTAKDSTRVLTEEACDREQQAALGESQEDSQDAQNQGVRVMGPRVRGKDKADGWSMR